MWCEAAKTTTMVATIGVSVKAGTPLRGAFVLERRRFVGYNVLLSVNPTPGDGHRPGERIEKLIKS